MSAFERRLGLTLLDRSRRGSALTPSEVVVWTRGLRRRARSLSR
jgi:DNA-binding transcriptional LysR family regulator